MARGRMLNNSVCASLKIHQLPDDTCRLMATWLISFLDKNGVFYADPVMVKSAIFPRRGDISYEIIEDYLFWMVSVGLIKLFEAKGEKWQFWPGFADNQTGLRPERERSDFPEPPDFFQNDDGSLPEKIRQDDGSLPENCPPKRKEEKRKEEEGPGGGCDEKLAQITPVYEQEIGLLSPIIADEIKDAIGTYPVEWINDALKICAEQNKRRWSYAMGILRRWQSNGRDSPAANGAANKFPELQPVLNARGEVVGLI